MIALFFKYLFKYSFIKPHYYGLYKRLFEKYDLFKNKEVMSLYDQDIRIQLKLDDFIQQQIFLLGYYDKPGILFLKKNLRPGAVFVDIGANIGAYTLIAAKLVAPSGKVFAFEPAMNVNHQLQNNIRLNTFDNIRVEKLALFNKNATLPLKISSSANLGMSSIHDHDEETGEIEMVPAIKGDDYFKQVELTKIDLIKLDIEGAELYALQGLELTIQKYRPLIFIELSEAVLQRSNIHKTDILDFMNQLHYEMHGINIEGAIVDMDANDLNDSENVAFVPLSIKR